MEMLAANLIVKRAASAAARAAVVVLPDDPTFYGGAGTHQFTGMRLEEVRKAAQEILKASSHFEEKASDLVVQVHPGSASPTTSRITVRVSAKFNCYAGWVSLVCGGNSRWLSSEATYAYHGAAYTYENES